MTPSEGQTAGYRIAWRTSGIRAGAHKGRMAGSGGLLRANVPLVQQPDPRRIAIRESLRDPAEQVLVRQTQQLSAVPVYVLIDVSASMGFAGRCRKVSIACDLAEALSVAA
ncbi:MAG: VWA domain-containing protein, partial [Hyphomicrobium sp.]